MSIAISSAYFNTNKGLYDNFFDELEYPTTSQSFVGKNVLQFLNRTIDLQIPHNNYIGEIVTRIDNREVNEVNVYQTIVETYLQYFKDAELLNLNSSIEIKAQYNINILSVYQQKEMYREAMYWVYDNFIDYYKQNKIEICDLMLQYIIPNNYNERILLSLLTATKPFCKKMNHRSDFYERVSNIICDKYSPTEAISILANLE